MPALNIDTVDPSNPIKKRPAVIPLVNQGQDNYLPLTSAENSPYSYLITPNCFIKAKLSK